MKTKLPTYFFATVGFNINLDNPINKIKLFISEIKAATKNSANSARRHYLDYVDCRICVLLPSADLSAR